MPGAGGAREAAMTWREACVYIGGWEPMWLHVLDTLEQTAIL